MPNTLNPNTVVWSVVIVFCAVLAAIVGLAFAVQDGARFETISSIILANVGTTIGVLIMLIRQDKQNQALSIITDQTNGVLDERIAVGVHKAIAAIEQGRRPDTVTEPLSTETSNGA